MLQFHPSGFCRQAVQTSLGSISYYTQVERFEAKSLSEMESRPPLLFLHSFGGGASAYEWSKVYPAFAPTHRILAIDLLGWGASAHPVKDYYIQDYLETLTEFIQQVATPVIVVASSLTAGLVVRLAVQQPDLFQALFLVCPSGFSDFGQDAGRRLPLQVINTPLLDRLIYTLGAMNEIAVRNFLERFLFAQPERVSQEMVAAYLSSAQQENAEYAALAFLRGDLYFDLSHYMGQLTVPTAIAWGEQAQFTKLSLGKRLASLNPRAVQLFQPIPETGVLPHLELPAVVIGLLQRCLQQWHSANPG